MVHYQKVLPHQRRRKKTVSKFNRAVDRSLVYIMQLLRIWILVHFLHVIEVDCLYKKWLKNTNLNNPYNWDSGRIPCGDDRMVIPDDGPVVFLQVNTTIRELVLPRSGEMVFGSYATLAFTNDPDHSATCLESGRDSTFNASSPEDWVNPNNWCPTDTEQGNCKDTPLLHTEQIPCSTDNAVFPTGSSYYVNLGTNLNIEVNTLKVSGKAYSQSSFRDYLSTDNGRNVFPPPSSGSRSTVTIHRRRCTDMTGCACGNDQGQMLEAVCRVQRSRCSRPGCTAALRPAGHCCDICGGMINVTIGVGFNFNTMKNALKRNFLDGKEKSTGIKYIVSKRSDGKIQIVLQDEDGIKSSGVARAMFSELSTDVNNGGIKYSVTGVTISTSAAGNSDSKASTHTGRTFTGSRGKVAGIVIGTIVGIFTLAAIGMFLYRRQRTDESSGGFQIFNKFNLRPERRPQIPYPPSVAFSWGSWGSRDSGLSSVGGASQGFENPIYGSTPLEEIKKMEFEMMPGDSSGISQGQPIDDRGFDNPLYENVHQSSVFADPTEVDSQIVETIGIPGLAEEQTDA